MEKQTVENQSKLSLSSPLQPVFVIVMRDKLAFGTSTEAFGASCFPHSCPSPTEQSYGNTLMCLLVLTDDTRLMFSPIISEHHQPCHTASVCSTTRHYPSSTRFTQSNMYASPSWRPVITLPRILIGPSVCCSLFTELWHALRCGFARACWPCPSHYQAASSSLLRLQYHPQKGMSTSTMYAAHAR